MSEIAAPHPAARRAGAVRLALIGDNIAASRAPLLHTIAGRLCGLDVRYERLVPAELAMSFEALLAHCRATGYRGVNVTYPHKERAAVGLHIPDPTVRRIGAVNTILFEPDGEKGFNTDYTGFVAAYRSVFGKERPGVATIVGAGGVGRAIAFALFDLGAEEVRLVDVEPAKVAALAAALGVAGRSTRVSACADMAAAAEGADGIVNCTPIGMVGHPGSAVPASMLAGRRWAFDAVYTPLETEFLRLARGCGVRVMTGFELFFHQGIDAFRLFTGRAVDARALRAELELEPGGEGAA